MQNSSKTDHKIRPKAQMSSIGNKKGGFIIANLIKTS